jgi:hypothetical protein
MRVTLNDAFRSVFAQWRHASEQAQGELVWIAEADDLSDPNVLSRMTTLMGGDANVKLAFNDGSTIDKDGSPQSSRKAATRQCGLELASFRMAADWLLDLIALGGSACPDQQ